MVTFYIIVSVLGNEMVATGRHAAYTYNINAAKHFTSEWSAENWRKKLPAPDMYMTKKIQRY